MRTKESEFRAFANSLSEFLAPRFAETLLRLAQEVIDEQKQKSRDEIVSKELQQLEPVLEQYRRNMESAAKGMGPGGRMQMRHIIKTIAELYKPRL